MLLQAFGKWNFSKRKECGTGILTHYHPAMPFGNRKIYFRGYFRSQFKIYYPSGNLKFNN